MDTRCTHRPLGHAMFWVLVHLWLLVMVMAHEDGRGHPVACRRVPGRGVRLHGLVDGSLGRVGADRATVWTRGLVSLARCGRVGGPGIGTSEMQATIEVVSGYVAQ